MTSAERSSAPRSLYTSAMLAAATALAGWPSDEDLPFKGTARSRTCGSTLAMGLALDEAGRIARLGLRPHACAVGQAAASVFARGAEGQDRTSLAASRDALALWLGGKGPQPDWPELDLLAPALDHPGRHGAILLAWDAALAALA